ncbi:TetR family transcriptional regulator [Alicyclobacillus cycloheptanicus]|uniref:AcrR family transcriptional regulator n=1 Tax=Alicyclobacillus cycloheptanicus TaxID=1457 RepID=A0ABT9XF39_9BACL|nr:TetR/AcrR family transcriptional regulator [Alicyclobacillus cycloheptanicus]MDQ0188689.1 AcrR family transcriptional regulator [Alicyclobacillus cycloheptanicus]WDM00639.1 TetR family transcriptional regulator [Alicyclobacillus cycloheptanicus]
MADRGRRDQILHAARTLFSEKGYHATTIRDIAQMSGLLSGSLYAHIRTKEDLLFEITDEVADQFLEGLQAVVDSADPPPVKFRRALVSHIQVVARNLDAARVFSHEWRALQGERRDRIQQKRDEYERLWTAVLSEGVAAGWFYPSHQRFARMVSLSVANWVYQWYDPSGQLSPEEVAGRLADVLLTGLQKPAASSKAPMGEVSSACPTE